MNCDDDVLEHRAKCKQTTGYAWEGTLQKEEEEEEVEEEERKKSLIYFTILYFS